jgi:trimeric autotransporter adhesin
MKTKLITKLVFLCLLPGICCIEAPAQNTVFTYQGRVSDSGTNFTGTGLFEFALVASTNNNHTATGTANAPTGGFITGYTLTFGGNGYVTAPAVHITGSGGSGATADTTISGGVVTSINAVSAGSGYTSAPTVTIDPPPMNMSYTTYWSNDGTSVNGSEPSNGVSVAVSGGLFTVVLGDATLPNMTAIPPSLFTTQTSLQLVIWFNDGVSGFGMLTPAQILTPTPYATFANSASNLLGALPAAQVSGTLNNGNLPVSPAFSGTVTATAFAGNGAGVTNVNAATLGGFGANHFWQITGNSGTTSGLNFVGTTDNQPLELHVNGQRALRLEPTTDSANIIGGSSGNWVLPGTVSSTIGGGGTLTGFFGGYTNSVWSSYDTIAGGVGNDIQTSATEATIGGGLANVIQTNDYAGTIAGGEFNQILQTAGGNSTIGGGYENFVGGFSSTIAGGYQNEIGAGGEATIGGGYTNVIQANAPYATIAGGIENIIGTNSEGSAISGGSVNTIGTGSYFSFIGGGDGNTIQSFYAFIGGGIGNTIGINSGSSMISGGSDNVIADDNGNSFIGGGVENTNGAPGSAISGGQQNTVEPGAKFSFVGSGLLNDIQADAAGGAIGGGEYNTIQGNATNSAISGGYSNLIQSNASSAVIGGGISNTISGSYAMIPGGFQNSATGNYSFAAGRGAKANATGSFVWADSQSAIFADSTPNSFDVRCQGGVGFTSGVSGTDQGVSWAPGSGAWLFSSDRNVKDRFAPVDDQAVLDKLSRLPLAEWSYKGYSQRHIGPMAQDWHALFPLNTNDKQLNELDVQGVALAAIQGLNQKLDEKDAEIADLKTRLEKLEQLVESKKTEITP